MIGMDRIKRRTIKSYIRTLYLHSPPYPYIDIHINMPVVPINSLDHFRSLVRPAVYLRLVFHAHSLIMYRRLRSTLTKLWCSTSGLRGVALAASSPLPFNSPRNMDMTPE